jgi:hypothetical protein
VDGYLTITDLVNVTGLDRATVRRRIHGRGIVYERGPGPGGGAILVRRELVPLVTADPPPRKHG